MLRDIATLPTPPQPAANVCGTLRRAGRSWALFFVDPGCNDQPVGPRAHEPVTERRLQAHDIIQFFQAGGSRHASHRGHAVRGSGGCRRWKRQLLSDGLALVRLDFENRGAVRRRAIEACTGDYCVAHEDRATPGWGDIHGAIGPANCHPLRPRRAHAFEVTDDAVRHALAGRDEFAHATGACREFANERLRDCTADTHREDPVARLLRLADNGLPIGDLGACAAEGKSH